MSETLFQSLRAAGVEVNNHGSDMYVPVTETTRRILEGFPIHKKNAKTFTDQVSGVLTYDIPFAFDPFWTCWPGNK